MTIFEIDNEIRKALEAVDTETGEWMGEEAYNELTISREAKIENTALYHKELSAGIHALADEIKSLQARKKAMENAQERCENLLQYALAGDKFATAKVDIRYRKSQAVEVTDEAAFIEFCNIMGHDDLLSFKDPVPNKTAIKAAIKDGKQLDFCQLKDNLSMVIK